jgi:hypothetical protein
LYFGVFSGTADRTNAAKIVCIGLDIDAVIDSEREGQGEDAPARTVVQYQFEPQ